jgi:hypothetical protein
MTLPVGFKTLMLAHYLAGNEMIIKKYLQSKCVLEESFATSFISSCGFHELKVLFVPPRH